MSSVHFASRYRWIVATHYWELPQQFDESVLDVGADDGYFLSQIQAPFKVGVDILVRESRLAPLIGADARRLPFADNAFGYVFAFDLLEHVSDDRGLLADVERVLRPGGTLWLSTPASRFMVFPGGPLQKRLHRSWGHVRRGYSADDLVARLSGNMEADFFYWNEPFYRLLYVLLKAMTHVSSTWTLWLVRWLAAVDACFRKGESGHLFAQLKSRSDA